MRNTASAIEHIITELSGYYRVKSSKLCKPVFLAFAIFFTVGIGVSIYYQPNILNNLKYIPFLILLFAAIPTTIMLNSFEFILSARLIDQRIPVLKAVEITIIGSAANMLPLPGSTVVRVAALTAGGAKLKDGILATALVALVWFGVAFAYGGSWLFVSGSTLIGSAAVTIGLAFLLFYFSAAFGMMRRWKEPVLISVNKLALVLIDAIRIYLCLMALGIDAVFAQASVLTISGVLGSAVSIVPAGLGLREAVSGAIAPLIALAVSAAYLATSLNRLADLAIIATTAAFLGWRGGAQRNTDSDTTSR